MCWKKEKAYLVFYLFIHLGVFLVSFPSVFRTYSWPYTHKSLLAELRGPYTVSDMEPNLAERKCLTPSTICLVGGRRYGQQ